MAHRLGARVHRQLRQLSTTKGVVLPPYFRVFLGQVGRDRLTKTGHQDTALWRGRCERTGKLAKQAGKLS